MIPAASSVPSSVSSLLSPARIAALRAATPGVRTVTHFNHAGASLPSIATLEAIKAHLWREATMGPIEAGVAAKAVTERARTLAARLLNADPAEIAITSGNSAGWSAAFAGLDAWRPGDRILTARHEWGGNVANMQMAAQRHGASVEVIPCDANGMADPQALETMLDARVRLIAITWLPANGGVINPAVAIGEVARRHAIPYFIDAAQALGQYPIDVAAVGCDVLTAACRKALRGPRGTGLLYVRRDFLKHLSPSQVDTHSAPLVAETLPDGAASVRAALRNDAARFETSEASFALHCGLANALEEALELGIDMIRVRIDATARAVRARLASIPGVTLLDMGIEQSGLVSFAVDGVDLPALQRGFADRGITISVNGVSYTPFDMRARGLSHVARASVSYLTTDDEIDILINGLRALMA
ncbi:class V aminotransferase [Robbsia andropogonis]|uniref:Class V aminotransferase n=1 Tax=Robbsia andropogonis TaxID=28092 RepID=A0A0F5K0U0_9BURK|nr:aminotransferase class V-fold PLP-dependent enzyme [Robbsia andropogonis]KKB63736.1 class V aminotransferase [Robbsia andropogonis]MCP1119247.1 aminotransferase class V-fold PLP-dependent enzyme [Robbsia andropogonis]MCP1129087.1 aminotransferase class V-fold PLP-dependent enzyme [Robbsia andropogonis]